MVTIEQAKQYLETVGITLPDFILQALTTTEGRLVYRLQFAIKYGD